MSLNPVTPTDTPHWYEYPTGKPCHTITGKNGKERSPYKREALVLNLKPSVTSLLKLLGKPGLESWKINQGILSALTHPNPDKLPADELAKLVAEESKREGKLASEKGKEIHAAIEQGFRTGNWSGDIATHFNAFVAHNFMFPFAGMLEHSFANENYGGTIDFIGKFQNKVSVIDYKTQDKEEFTFYPESCYQLAAYADAAKEIVKEPIEQIVSIIISRTVPGQIEYKIWTDEERAPGLKIFNHVLSIWYLQNGWELK